MAAAGIDDFGLHMQTLHSLNSQLEQLKQNSASRLDQIAGEQRTLSLLQGWYAHARSVAGDAAAPLAAPSGTPPRGGAGGAADAGGAGPSAAGLRRMSPAQAVAAASVPAWASLQQGPLPPALFARTALAHAALAQQGPLSPPLGHAGAAPPSTSPLVQGVLTQGGLHVAPPPPAPPPAFPAGPLLQGVLPQPPAAKR